MLGVNVCDPDLDSKGKLISNKLLRETACASWLGYSIRQALGVFQPVHAPPCMELHVYMDAHVPTPPYLYFHAGGALDSLSEHLSVLHAPPIPSGTNPSLPIQSHCLVPEQLLTPLPWGAQLVPSMEGGSMQPAGPRSLLHWRMQGQVLTPLPGVVSKAGQSLLPRAPPSREGRRVGSQFPFVQSYRPWQSRLALSACLIPFWPRHGLDLAW